MLLPKRPKNEDRSWQEKGHQHVFLYSKSRTFTLNEGPFLGFLLASGYVLFGVTPSHLLSTQMSFPRGRPPLTSPIILIPPSLSQLLNHLLAPCTRPSEHFRYFVVTYSPVWWFSEPLKVSLVLALLPFLNPRQFTQQPISVYFLRAGHLRLPRSLRYWSYLPPEAVTVWWWDTYNSPETKTANNVL